MPCDANQNTTKAFLVVVPPNLRQMFLATISQQMLVLPCTGMSMAAMGWKPFCCGATPCESRVQAGKQYQGNFGNRHSGGQCLAFAHSPEEDELPNSKRAAVLNEVEGGLDYLHRHGLLP